MKQSLKVHEFMNETVTGALNEFPDFMVKCKLYDIMKDRGMGVQELRDLTGLRLATISDIANMKNISLNFTQLLVIAKTLRIYNLGELFEFEMSDETYQQFLEDRKEIDRQGVLPDQREILKEAKTERDWIKKERKLIKQFHKIIKEKPTVN
jgi:DNA-binding Xre family transcriptional regulator